MAKPVPKDITNIKINLLRPQGLPEKIPVKFVKWLMSYGRFIVILVEVIVLGCFIIRFSLDNQLANLKNKIDSQVKIIQSQSQDEALVKQTQDKLLLIKQNYDSSPNWQTFFNTISAKLPTNTTLTGINIEHTNTSKSIKFKITAITHSNSDINAFIRNMQGQDQVEADRLFQSVELSGLGYEKGQMTFSVSGVSK